MLRDRRNIGSDDEFILVPGSMKKVSRALLKMLETIISKFKVGKKVVKRWFFYIIYIKKCYSFYSKPSWTSLQTSRTPHYHCTFVHGMSVMAPDRAETTWWPITEPCLPRRTGHLSQTGITKSIWRSCIPTRSTSTILSERKASFFHFHRFVIFFCFRPIIFT